MTDDKIFLNCNQRSHRARAEYIKGMLEIWNKIKKEKHVDDEIMFDEIDCNCDLGIGKMWENLLEQLQSKLEKKYHVHIEHDDEFVKVFAWTK